MIKEINSYLPLYLGSWVWVKDGEDFILNEESLYKMNWDYDRYKLILRSIGDLTDDELMKIADMVGRYGDRPGERKYEIYLNTFNEKVLSWGPGTKEKLCVSSIEYYKPEVFRYLLSIGIDMFGLIVSGLGVKISYNGK